MWLRHRGEARPGGGVRWTAGWPLAVVLLVTIVQVVPAVLLHWPDLSALPQHAGATVAEVGGPLVALVYTFLAGPVAEEFGWRGYVQPRLRQTHGILATTALLGAAWAGWHVPLFFLNGTGQHDLGLFTLPGLAFFLGFFPLTYLLLFVTEHLRGGVPAAILMHAAWNLSDELVPAPGAGGTWLKLAVLFATAGAVCGRQKFSGGGVVGGPAAS